MNRVCSAHKTGQLQQCLGSRFGSCLPVAVMLDERQCCFHIKVSSMTGARVYQINRTIVQS